MTTLASFIRMARNTFLNDKYVFTIDGTMIGNVVLNLNELFLVRSIEEH